MESEQPFTDGDLTIQKLAEKLSIPAPHLSQTILGNTTHGSGWMFQVQPSPGTSTFQAGSEQSTHSRGWYSKSKGVSFVGRN